jgi:hypothetical protein
MFIDLNEHNRFILVFSEPILLRLNREFFRKRRQTLKMPDSRFTKLTQKVSPELMFPEFVIYLFKKISFDIDKQSRMAGSFY